MPIARLIEIIQEVAGGNYSNDIMDLTGPDEPDYVRRIAEAMGMMMVKVEAREYRLEMLVKELEVLNEKLRQSALNTVTAMAGALAARDEYTEGHAARVGEYAARLAVRLGLPDEDVSFVRLGGMLHDIGKIGFSDKVFTNEDTKVTEELMEEIRQHPMRGVAILQHLDFLGPALSYVRHHHERLDGKGYPDGLKGDEIPLGARIVSVADVYDAITTDRPYQKGKTPEEALQIMRKISGSSLDGPIVEAFAALLTEDGRVAVQS